MFDTYYTAKTEKPRKWVAFTFTFSVIAHALGGIALVIYSFWKI